MHLIRLVYWNEGKSVAECERQKERFACLWRIKGEHSLTWEQKILRNLSMLIYSHDYNGKRYQISQKGWLNELWMYFWVTWFYFFQRIVCCIFIQILCLFRGSDRGFPHCVALEWINSWCCSDSWMTKLSRSSVSQESHQGCHERVRRHY